MNVSSQQITLSNTELTRFFFAIALLLSAANLLGYIATKLRMPKVIGEIMGGVILGPSVLGYVFPEISSWVFFGFESEAKLISVIYWFGLVLLMFISGFEIDTSLDRNDRKLIVGLFAGSTLIPFFAGWISPNYFNFSELIGSKNNLLAFKIVIACAFAVTSIPVISKIFIDLGIIKSRFAKIVIATATIHDVVLWAILAVATGLVAQQGTQSHHILMTVLVTVSFFALGLIVLPKLFVFVSQLRLNLLMRSSASGYALLTCFLFAALTSLLDINVAFGALLAGILIGHLKGSELDKVKAQIKDFSISFFVPLYFAVVGFKIDLIHHFNLGLFFIILFSSFLFQLFGTVLSARILKKDWLSSFNFGVAMNTRGGPGIVLATVAFDMGIISQTFFVILVLIAVLTSLIAGAWFRYVLAKKLELLS